MSLAAKHPLYDRNQKFGNKLALSAGKRLDSAVKDQKNLGCDELWFLHEPLIQIGVTCKKIVVRNRLMAYC